MAEAKALQRRLELHRMLTRKHKVLASALARKWSCDEKTVRRDLTDMRDIDHLPVEYDPVGRTWRYTRAHIPCFAVTSAFAAEPRGLNLAAMR